ncbi:hypothetical protein ACEPPN_004852 [Leptodophora sp. 'Broadleaf-Isolate-01']
MSGIDSIYDRLRPGLVDAFRNIFPPGFPFNVPAPATPIPTYKPAVPYDAVSGLSDSDYETSFGQTGSGSTISSLAMVLTTSFWVGIYDFTSHEVYQFASFNFALTFQPHDLNLYNLWSDWFKFHGPDNEYCAIFGYFYYRTAFSVETLYGGVCSSISVATTLGSTIPTPGSMTFTPPAYLEKCFYITGYNPNEYCLYVHHSTIDYAYEHLHSLVVTDLYQYQHFFNNFGPGEPYFVLCLFPQYSTPDSHFPVAPVQPK